MMGAVISELINCTLQQFQVKTAVTKPRATSSPLVSVVSEEDERISNRAITPGKPAICNCIVKLGNLLGVKSVDIHAKEN